MNVPMIMIFASLWLSSLTSQVHAYDREEILALHGRFLSKERMEKLVKDLRRLQGPDDTIDELFNHRFDIHREILTLSDGVIATTTSDDQDVVTLIHTHVRDMENLDTPIRQGDPLFASLFQNIDQTVLQVEYLDSGVRVTHTGITDCGAALVQDHAAQVSSFVDTGVRRPNWSWVEPASCANPQTIGSSQGSRTTVSATTMASPTANAQGTTPSTGLASGSTTSVVTPTTEVDETSEEAKVASALGTDDDSSAPSLFTSMLCPTLLLVGFGAFIISA